MKNLENYGVLELNAKEIRETDGGNWAALAVFAYWVADNYDEIKRGWDDAGTGYSY